MMLWNYRYKPKSNIATVDEAVTVPLRAVVCLSWQQLLLTVVVEHMALSLEQVDYLAVGLVLMIAD